MVTKTDINVQNDVMLPDLLTVFLFQSLLSSKGLRHPAVNVISVGHYCSHCEQRLDYQRKMRSTTVCHLNKNGRLSDESL